MKTLNLYIFIDAFGWEILRRHSFLDDIVTVKIPLNTIFGYSSTCDPTIITGQLPRVHGHFSFFYYNPQESPFRLCRYLAVLPHALTRRGRVRRVISRLLQRYYGFTGYFQIYNMPFREMHYFDYSEKRDIYQEGGINSGAPTIFTRLRQDRIPFFLSDWRLPEEKNLSALTAAVAEGEIQFAYLYLAAMDAILHQYGTQSPFVDEKIAWYDCQIRRIFAHAQNYYDRVNLTVFSDHGMTDVVGLCDLMTPIQSLGLRFGVDYAAVYDSTMARFWFLNTAARDPITQALQRVEQGRILSARELLEFGCDFPGDKYGELIFMLNPGILLCPSFMGETPLKGMHGYDPRHPDSTASFSTNAPPDPLPSRLDDLYRVMNANLVNSSEGL